MSSAAPHPSLDKIENYFKMNVQQLVSYLATNFSCAKTQSQLKLLETIVFPSSSFTAQMIMQWHKSMEPFYAAVEGGSIDSMLASKAVWFVERIDLAEKYARLAAEDRTQIVNYFKGLNKLARNYAALNSSELAKLVAATAASKAVELPEMPEDARERAQWAVDLTREVLGALSQEQVNRVIDSLPSFVDAMGGPEKVLEQARAYSLVSSEEENPTGALDSLGALLNPEMIRALVGGLQDSVKDMTVPSKSGEAVPLSDLVGDTSRVLSNIVEGKADASEVAGLGQRITETVDWDQIMGLMPPEIATVGRQLVGQVMQQTSGAEGAAEPVDMSKVMETVQTLTSSLAGPDSPFASLLSGLLGSAGAPGAESPLAALLSPRK